MSTKQILKAQLSFLFLSLFLCLPMKAAAQAPLKSLDFASNFIVNKGSVPAYSSIINNGSGCARGMQSYSSASPYGTFVFGDLRAAQVFGSSPGDARKSCYITMNVTPESGMQYRIASVEANGESFAREAGSRSIINVKYFLTASPQTSTLEHTMNSELNGPFSVNNVGAQPTPISPWTTCGETTRAINLSIYLRVTQGSKVNAVFYLNNLKVKWEKRICNGTDVIAPDPV